MEIVGAEEMSIEEARQMGLLPEPVMTFVFFNGPAGSGKDHMASLLVRRGQDAMHVKFSGTLKSVVSSGVGMSQDDLEKIKEEKLFGPNGTKSYRDLQIDLYQYLEKEFDDRILGRIVVDDIRRRMEQMPSMGYAFFFSDAGRGPEVDHVAQAFGKNRCLIIRMHREGCEFNDYRQYVHIDGIETWDVDNDGTKTFAEDLMQRIVKWTQMSALVQQGIRGSAAQRAIEIHEQISKLQKEFDEMKRVG